MQATGNEIIKNNPQAQILYTTTVCFGESPALRAARPKSMGRSVCEMKQAKPFFEKCILMRMDACSFVSLPSTGLACSMAAVGCRFFPKSPFSLPGQKVFRHARIYDIPRQCFVQGPVPRGPILRIDVQVSEGLHPTFKIETLRPSVKTCASPPR